MRKECQANQRQKASARYGDLELLACRLQCPASRRHNIYYQLDYGIPQPGCSVEAEQRPTQSCMQAFQPKTIVNPPALLLLTKSGAGLPRIRNKNSDKKKRLTRRTTHYLTQS